MSIPTSPVGWAIDLERRILHRRYADHARGLPRVRTAAEVRTYLGDSPTGCSSCWPPEPEPIAPAKRTRRARVAIEDKPPADFGTQELGYGEIPDDLQSLIDSATEREDPDAPGDDEGSGA